PRTSVERHAAARRGPPESRHVARRLERPLVEEAQARALAELRDRHVREHLDSAPGCLRSVVLLADHLLVAGGRKQVPAEPAEPAIDLLETANRLDTVDRRRVALEREAGHFLTSDAGD